MAVEQYANNASTTLNGAINNSVTSIVVTSAANFPANPNFRIKIENELLLVTAVAGTTFTVTRGVEGTTGASHVDTTAVYHIMTAASLLKLTADGELSGAYSTLPTAGREGRIFLPTDSPLLLRDNGSSWDAFLKQGLVPVTPSASDFTTWLNQNSATIDTTKGIHNLEKFRTTTTSSNDVIGRTKAMGGLSTWQMRLIFQYDPPNGSVNTQMGIILRESGSGHFIHYAMDDSSAMRLTAYNWNSVTSFNASQNARTWSARRDWQMLQLRSDGTSLFFEYSTDGYNWYQYQKLTIASCFVPSFDTIGFGANFASYIDTNQTGAMRVAHALYG